LLPVDPADVGYIAAPQEQYLLTTSNISLVQASGPDPLVSTAGDRWLLTGDDGAFSLAPPGRQADGSFRLTLRLVLQCSFVHEADSRPWITLVKQAVVRRADSYRLSFQLLPVDPADVGYIAAPQEQYLLTTSIPPQVFDLRVLRDGTLAYASRERTADWMSQDRTAKPQHIPFNTVRLIDGVTGAPLARPPPELVHGTGEAEWSRAAMVALPAMAWAPREWYGDGVEETAVSGSPTLAPAAGGASVPMDDDAMDGGAPMEAMVLPPAAATAAPARRRRHVAPVRHSAPHLAATTATASPARRPRRHTDGLEEADIVMHGDASAAGSDCAAGASDDDSEATVSLPADDRGPGHGGRSRRNSVISVSEHDSAVVEALPPAPHDKPALLASGHVFVTPERWPPAGYVMPVGAWPAYAMAGTFGALPVSGAVSSPSPFAPAFLHGGAYGAYGRPAFVVAPPDSCAPPGAEGPSGGGGSGGSGGAGAGDAYSV
jgi:hypothetical protein